MRSTRDLWAFIVAASPLACAPPSPTEPLAVVVPVSPPSRPRVDAGPIAAADAGGASRPVRIVARGTLEPTHPDIGGPQCPGMEGARWREEPIRVSAGGESRQLHVFARARGPIGVRANDQCASAASNGWARIDLDRTLDDLEIRVADIDMPGERRGQTSPFVVVVSDSSVPPPEEPDARPLLGPNDVAVRWALAPTSCENTNNAICERATIELSGALKKRIPLRRVLTGQSGCWPAGTGIRCGGASGSSDLSITPTASGVVRVSEYQQSDGYCPPPDDCGATVPWTTFLLPPGLRLVPDPEGTFPPDARPAPP